MGLKENQFWSYIDFNAVFPSPPGKSFNIVWKTGRERLLPIIPVISLSFDRVETNIPVVVVRQPNLSGTDGISHGVNIQDRFPVRSTPDR